MFEFDGSASYLLKRQARALTALEGDTDRNRFLVASLELRDANELQVLDFNEDTNEVACMRAYTHPHETWHMASCPAPEHVELVTTVYSTGAEQRAVRPRPQTTLTAFALLTQRAAHTRSATVPSPAQTLWRLDGLDDASERSDGTGAPPAPPAATPPTELLQLGGVMRLGECRGVLWNAVLPEQVCVLREGSLSAFQLSHGGAASSAAELASISLAEQDWGGATFACGRWDPHHAHSLALGCERALVTLDMRTMKQAHAVPAAHQQALTSIDYNPNKPHVLLTCADDYAIRYWDLRKPAAPLLTQKAHSHSVRRAASPPPSLAPLPPPPCRLSRAAMRSMPPLVAASPRDPRSPTPRSPLLCPPTPPGAGERGAVQP